jgi:hypothetical protein
LNTSILCVGIRGPIILRQPFGVASSIDGDDYPEAEETPGAVEALLRLSKDQFHDSVNLIVKCDSGSFHNRASQWLNRHTLFQRTGIPETHLYFCGANEDVADLCAKIGATHFVFSQLAPLKKMTASGVRLYAFDPHPQDIKRHAFLFANRPPSLRPGSTSSPPRSLKLCRTWDDVLTDLNLGANS